MNILKFKVIDKIQEIEDAYSFLLQPLDDTALVYKPGQYLPVRIDHEKGMFYRSYSFSSSPEVDREFKFTVKRETGGKGSNWLCDNVKIGDQLKTLRPAGDFLAKDLDGYFVFFAGGSGITPIISIIKSALHNKKNKIKLFYANSSKKSIIFEKEIKDLILNNPDDFQVVFWLDDEKGVPTDTDFKDYINNDFPTQYFLCGPAPFMAAVEKTLVAASVPEEQVTKESFVSNAFKPVEEVMSNSSKDVRVRVVLNGVTTDVMCSEDNFILNDLVKSGLNIPNSCGAGNCGSCMCNLVSGDVYLETNAVLDASDEKEGWILACRSKPKSKEIEISFDH